MKNLEDENNNIIFNINLKQLIKLQYANSKSFHYATINKMYELETQEVYLNEIKRSIENLNKHELNACLEIAKLLNILSSEVNLEDYNAFNYRSLKLFYENYLLSENMENNKTIIFKLLFTCEYSILCGFIRSISIQQNDFKNVMIRYSKGLFWDYKKKPFILFVLAIDIEIFKLEEVY
jgi:hypothetical protein